MTARELESARSHENGEAVGSGIGADQVGQTIVLQIRRQHRCRSATDVQVASSPKPAAPLLVRTVKVPADWLALITSG